MSKKTPNPNPKSQETEPQQSPFLGDLTPEYIVWHAKTHTEEEHRQRYFDRIPHEYAEKHGIERV